MELIFLGLVFVLYQIWLLPVLTDWVSSAVDEGFTGYAAQRIRQGQWPHRDFFYLWTPGTPLLHAALQNMGIGWLGERASAMLAAISSSILTLWMAKEWGFSRGDLRWLALLLASWSFSLWNIPYSSWYALPIALLGIRLFSKRPWMAGATFALCFWFKQNIGLLSFSGALLGALIYRSRGWSFRLAAGMLAGLGIPFLGILLFGGKAALLQSVAQIFFFPLRYPGLMGSAPSADVLAAPLTSLGLWVLSLYFVHAGVASKSVRLIQVGLFAYLSFYFLRKGWSFVEGGLFVLSVAAFLFSILFCIASDEKSLRPRFFIFWLPAFGAFLQIYPRMDFQHFLFVFPLTAFLLVYFLSSMSRRYPTMPYLWARLPIVLLVLGGVGAQLEVMKVRLEGKRDSLGRVSSGSGFRLNEEVTAVWRFLRSEGLGEGDPILVLPNATSVYQWTGFRNPTPHLQFFPGYVEAFGARQEEVLSNYRETGGKFLVVQERSGLEKNVPEIFSQIQRDYQIVKSFPEHFTIYSPK